MPGRRLAFPQHIWRRRNRRCGHSRNRCAKDTGDERCRFARRNRVFNVGGKLNCPSGGSSPSGSGLNSLVQVANQIAIQRAKQPRPAQRRARRLSVTDNQDAGIPSDTTTGNVVDNNVSSILSDAYNPVSNGGGADALSLDLANAAQTPDPFANTPDLATGLAGVPMGPIKRINQAPTTLLM